MSPTLSATISGDRILQIHDRGDCRFENDIGDARCIVTADRVRAIDENLERGVVVDQENCGGRIRTAAIAAQLLGIPKSDRVAILER